MSSRLASAAAAVAVVVLTASAALPVGARSPDPWVPPVPGPSIVRAFDPPERRWESGHRGADYSAGVGETIRAPADSTVAFAGSVAGKPVVSLDVGQWRVSYEAVDAIVAAGDEVSAGEPIGAVSDLPHCPQGCVHVGVRTAAVEDSYVDPADFFAPASPVLLPDADAPEELPADSDAGGGSGPGGWGGHENGRIPAVAMCPLESAPGHRLRCDAARAFDSLSADFHRRFGRPISVTDSYRDYETQVRLKREKGRMAAAPGTSNHGWGLAVDLGGGINRFGTAEHEWMRAHAGRRGWVHPPWARASGSLPEAWHWEFNG